MELNTIEFIKTVTPYILFFLTVVAVPILRNAYSSCVSFFSLPVSKKLEAIDYLQNPIISENPLKKIKHQIIMTNDFRLHEDITLSKQVILFYYDNKARNAAFSKAVLRARGLYKIENGFLNVKFKMTLLIVFFGVLSIAEYIWSVYTYKLINEHAIGLIFSVSIFICGILYTLFTFSVTYHLYSLFKSAKRFNEFNSDVKTKSISGDSRNMLLNSGE